MTAARPELGFAYGAWLEGALRGTEAEAGALLEAMARRVGAGWEVAELVQLQCVALGRAAAAAPAGHGAPGSIPRGGSLALARQDNALSPRSCLTTGMSRAS